MDATHPYVVIDMQTRTVVARCATLQGARRSADRRDLKFGAIRYRAMSFTSAIINGHV